MTALLVALPFATALAAPTEAPAASDGGLRAKITDKAIAQAVRETLADTVENPRRHEADVLKVDKWQKFSQDFEEAKVPDCLHPDGLKRQPPVIGFISFQGLYAIPFVVLAKARGKCL
ncbi:hypothetical protein E4O92_06510 [Massilia horti]|uniref:Uncharacterized protein n=2 Tax=Massilia horti TaxID=2562153 RepID=A0A4Y9T373_9BURK|nr:hypothetical protein E4O92_06510 [Massilia horti]